MKAIATIEKGNDGTYDITLEYNKSIPFGLLGQGTTVEEAMEDFLNSYAEMKELMITEGKECPELEFEFAYDTASFLQSLSTTFTMAGLSAITGINRKQLGHYVQGVAKPRPSTARRIQERVVDYAQKLSTVSFV